MFKEISILDENFKPKFKPLLSDEALIIYKENTGIRLSHYNLLVNVNSIYKVLKYPSQSRISIKIPCDSISYRLYLVLFYLYTLAI